MEEIDLTVPLLCSDDVILVMNDYNVKEFDENEFDEEFFIHDFYLELMASYNNPEKITRKMILFDTFSFKTSTRAGIVYWMPYEHRISDFLQIYNIDALTYDDNCGFGDIVIHSAESVNFFVAKMVGGFKYIVK